MSQRYEEEPVENPAEPVPDVASAAEPAQPAEPEYAILSEALSGRRVSDAESLRTTRTSEHLTEPEPTVDPAAGILEEDDNVRETDAEAENYPGAEELLQKSEQVERTPVKQFNDRFSQTFLKYMKNLTDNRFVEIVNMDIDHGDRALVFHCPSEDLLRSFDDVQSCEE